jgi:hypothetical protein
MDFSPIAAARNHNEVSAMQSRIFDQTDKFPENPKFSGHETFPFRYPWMHKVVEGVIEKEDIFINAEEAMQTFGVGKNMVAAMQHWAVAVNVIEPSNSKQGRKNLYHPTPLGKKLFKKNGWDPYLEDTNTIWLLQWWLVHDVKAALPTWWWAFNSYQTSPFSKQSLARSLSDTLTLNGKTVPRALDRDIDVFIKTYVATLISAAVKDDTLDCPLTELRLIRKSTDDQNFQFTEGYHGSLADDVFVYALMDYIKHRGGSTVPLEDLLFGPGSPGRVFRLSEAALISRLERLATITNDDLHFDETAGLKQVFVHVPNEALDENALLEKHYQSQEN